MSVMDLEFREPIRYEVIGGKIYYMASPATNHNKIINNLIRIFGDFLDGKKCTVFGENVDVYFDEKNKEVKPDLKIVCDPSKITAKNIEGAPDLVVEVLSKYNADHDRITKMSLYEKFGVKEYWIINIPNKEVEVYLLTDGKFAFDKRYGVFTEQEIKEREEDPLELESVKEFVRRRNIKTSIFGDDLLIPTEKIFRNLI
ncbi:MAG: Uma2 family endonuclease [Oscillospiraceae bacterium]|nr:Uma2 family endonuclease [Oscillospiraceae bacterium]